MFAAGCKPVASCAKILAGSLHVNSVSFDLVCIIGVPLARLQCSIESGVYNLDPRVCSLDSVVDLNIGVALMRLPIPAYAGEMP